jgi:hypothetical protein
MEYNFFGHAIGFLVHLNITPYQFGEFLMPLRPLLNQSRILKLKYIMGIANLLNIFQTKVASRNPVGLSES